VNKYLIGAMLTALCAATAIADDDPMAGFYGNTIVARKVGETWKSMDGKRTFTLKAGVH
jgi:hypothetical protein